MITVRGVSGTHRRNVVADFVGEEKVARMTEEEIDLQFAKIADGFALEAEQDIGPAY